MAEKPVIVLSHPQIGENIGATARAMLNCGLTDLRLINPRDGWPNETATTNASGALESGVSVTVYNDLESATADCQYIFATTARLRDMDKPVMTPRESAIKAHQGKKCAYLFGRERSGLTNEEVAYAHAIVNIPLNPDFSSLNLSQAVLVCAYEWGMARDIEIKQDDHIPADNAQFHEMTARLIAELEDHQFFRSEGLKPTMINNIRTALTRAEMTDQEVRTFHGIISALTGKKL